MNIPSEKHTMHIGIRGRLIIGFAAITVFFLVTIGITSYAITAAKKYSNQVVDVDIPTHDALLDLNTEIYISQLITQKLIFTNDMKYKSELNNALDVKLKIRINH